MKNNNMQPLNSEEIFTLFQGKIEEVPDASQRMDFTTNGMVMKAINENKEF